MFQVVQAPDQILRVKTKFVKKITPEHQKIIKGMIKTTLTFEDPEGVGLASTQIGKDEQYFVLKRLDKTFVAVFNPKILTYSKRKKLFFEGCLSIPNFFGEIQRPISVTVSYQDENGKKVKRALRGIEAWIFQHEYDHLQGKLFMDHVMEQKAKLFKVVGKDRTGADIFEQVAL